MKEYKIRYLKMILNYLWSISLIIVGFRIVIYMLYGFEKSNDPTQKMLWIVILGLFGFAWKIPRPNFEDCVYEVERGNGKSW